MGHNRSNLRRIVTRSLAVIVMLCVYGIGLIGGSALLLGASSTSALARGGGRGFGGGGFRGGGFRGAGIGLGLGYYGYPYYSGYYPYYQDEGVCYAVRRRVMTRYGWRIRRVSICE
jgi:hypothetical protein